MIKSYADLSRLKLLNSPFSHAAAVELYIALCEVARAQKKNLAHAWKISCWDFKLHYTVYQQAFMHKMAAHSILVKNTQCNFEEDTEQTQIKQK